jgi:hypothetical protein
MRQDCRSAQSGCQDRPPAATSQGGEHWLFSFDRILSVVGKDHFKLAPGGVSRPISLLFYLFEPFAKDLKLQFIFGCDGMVPLRIDLLVPVDDVRAFYDEINTSREERQPPTSWRSGC